MSLPEAPRRRYSDREVARLLRRATELQREDPAGGEGGGLTLRELEDIAVEAGIDRRYVQAAARELASARSGGFGTSALGGPLLIQVERSVPVELRAEQLERLLPTIQFAADGHGNPTQVGRTLTWRSQTTQNERSLQVMITSRDGETWIRAEERLHGIAAQLFLGLGIGGGVGVGVGVGLPVGLEVLGSTAFATAFPLGVIGLAFLGARAFFKAHTSKRRRTLEGLVDQLEQQIHTLGER